MQFGTLLGAVKDQVVLFPHYISRCGWRVVRVRDVRKNPLEPDTFRRRPDRIRSQSYVVLRSVATGRFMTFYRAENVQCLLLDM